MKFVIRSLLFVNLLLQMTNSLRQCFNHDQNIMITIILLAFSVIGLIGLVIGNRFILIIFSASMTLILIASITIYAIGKTDEDTLKPKVPYYTSREALQEAAGDKRLRGSALRGDDKRDHRFRSLVDRWLSSNSSKPVSKEEAARARARQKGPLAAKGRQNGTLGQQQQPAGARARLGSRRLAAGQQQAATTKLSPALLDELSDDPTTVDLLPELAHVNLRAASQPSVASQRPTGKRLDEEPPAGPDAAPDPEEGATGDERVESEQWVAYERLLYEQYLNMVSQSIDLVMHTILAAWMALLLDEDSDQCFGPKTSPRRRPGTAGAGRPAGSKAPPVYNYNGVRYSIRPDVDDSLARVVVN